MNCMHCMAPQGGEHRVDCPIYEPPLTQEEIRTLRRLLAGSSLGVFAGPIRNPQVGNSSSAPETGEES